MLLQAHIIFVPKLEPSVVVGERERESVTQECNDVQLGGPALPPAPCEANGRGGDGGERDCSCSY